jgi:D-3-phosphoglycerate dehydrogenase
VIYVTDYLSNLEIERKNCDYDVYSYLDKSFDKHDDIRALLVWHKKINAEYLAQFPNVKFIQRYGVGYDVIDLDYCRENGIICSNNPDYGVEEVSLTAIAMILNLSRKIGHYNQVASNLIRHPNETWQENIHLDTKRLSECSLGIIGFGRIGQRVTQSLKDVFSEVLIYDPYVRSGVEKVFRVTRAAAIDEILNGCDVISIHCPLTNETRGLVDANFIGKLKKSPIIVNTARGELIEDLNLVLEAIKSGAISAIGLDVLPDEPPVRDDFINYFLESGDARILLNPHTAYYSRESYVEMRSKAISNCVSFLNGSTVNNIL